MAKRGGSGGNRRRPSRVVRPSAARKEALQKQMAKVFQLAWAKGFSRLRGAVSADALADAYMAGNYEALIKFVPFRNMPDLLSQALAEVGKANVVGGSWGKDAVPNSDFLRYDMTNPRIATYVAERQGAYIQRTNDDFTKSVQNMVQSRFGFATSDAKASSLLLDPVKRRGVTGYVLKNSLGLDSRSAGALARRSASGDYTKKQLFQYETQLHVQRAERIARTEIAYATNNGQMAVWKDAQAQGLIEANARKVWTVDGAPCEVCQPMDGLSVPLDEEFLAPNGDSVMAPPLHPSCLCVLTLIVDADDDTDTPENRTGDAYD